MDDPATILKELRVDWENIVSDDFNPLALSLRIMGSSALAADFRDMTHRLDTAMEAVVSTHFRGFSDAVLGYDTFRTANTDGLSALARISEGSRAVHTEDLGLSDLTAAKGGRDAAASKHMLCRGIREVRTIATEGFEDKTLVDKASAVVQALDLIDCRDYVRIKGIDEFRKTIYSKYTVLVSEANARVLNFVFNGSFEDIRFFECVAILGSLPALEIAFSQHFHSRVFRAVESIISSFAQKGTTVENLCMSVSKKFLSIRKNMATVSDLVARRFETDASTGTFAVRGGDTPCSFFGRCSSPFRFCTDGDFVCTQLISELELFINAYSGNDQEVPGFHLEWIVDDIDYGSVYGPGYAITNHLCKGGDLHRDSTTHDGVDGGREYTLITAPSPDVVFHLLRNITDPSLRSFLEEKIKETHSGRGLERGKERVDLIFESPMRVDLKTMRVSCFEEIDRLVGGEKGAYQGELKAYVNKRLCEILRRHYSALFVSDVVVSPGEEPSDSPFDDSFRESLIKKYINKKDLFLNRQKYQMAVAIINTLRALEKVLGTEEVRGLHGCFLRSFQRQLNIEFFYFFDLLYRQGNYLFYMRNIVRILRTVCAAAGHEDGPHAGDAQTDGNTRSSVFFEGLYDNIEFYCVQNAPALHTRSREELVRFVDNLRILDEVMGELEFYSSLDSLYRFFDDVLHGTSRNRYGRVLQHKIGQESVN